MDREYTCGVKNSTFFAKKRFEIASDINIEDSLCVCTIENVVRGCGFENLGFDTKKNCYVHKSPDNLSWCVGSMILSYYVILFLRVCVFLPPSKRCRKTFFLLQSSYGESLVVSWAPREERAVRKCR